MVEKIIISGFGGQGIMSLGQMLSYSGLDEGREVCWLPSYGPEMRGGTANCQVIISDEPIASPVISQADSAIVMNLPSLEKFEPMVKKGGKLFINSSLVTKRASRNDIQVYYIPANEIAAQIGNQKVSGMAVLGAYLKAAGIIKVQSVIESLAKVLGSKKADVLPANMQAMERGSNYV